jgi:hypothetical protein
VRFKQKVGGKPPSRHGAPKCRVSSKIEIAVFHPRLAAKWVIDSTEFSFADFRPEQRVYEPARFNFTPMRQTNAALRDRRAVTNLLHFADEMTTRVNTRRGKFRFVDIPVPRRKDAPGGTSSIRRNF